MSVNSFDARRILDVDGQSYEIYDITKVDGSDNLPYSLKVLLENLLRTEDGANITAEQITELGHWDADAQPSKEIQFTPARVIMQDFTGVPCIVTWPPCARLLPTSVVIPARSTHCHQQRWSLTCLLYTSPSPRD